MKYLLFLLSLAAAPLQAAEQQFAQLGDLKLESGAVIKDCAIGYRTVGTLNAQASNAVVMFTWHTGTSENVVGMLKPEKLFDPAPYFVIVIDAIGNGVSCSPSNSKTQHGAAFPRFSVRDMVQSQYRVLTEKLGIKHVHAMLGFSLGALQTFEWMRSHPGFADVSIPISGTPLPATPDLLFWRTAEMAIVGAPGYNEGNYKTNPNLPLYNLLFTISVNTPAHRIAKTSHADFEKFFQETVVDAEAPDTNDSLWQIRAILSHNAGAPVPGRAHIIVARQDHFLNPAPSLEYAKAIGAGVTVLESDCGHSALLCEMPLARKAIEQALQGPQKGQ